MSFASIARLFASGLACLASCAPAHAAEVAFQLDSVTVAQCGPCSGYYYCYEYNFVCETPVARQLNPDPPQGNGQVDLDSTGVLIGGSVSLAAHSQDGAAIPAWSRALARRDPLLRAHFLAFTGWGDAEIRVMRFTSQRDFAGNILNAYSVPTGPDTEERIIETYSFQALSGGPAPVCEGERLHFDEDTDGEEDARDLAPLGLTDSEFGAGVDGAGRTVADFCRENAPVCGHLDFRNDEPVRGKPRDCKRFGVACRPREFSPGAVPPPLAGPTCQGLPVFADTDGDGEADATDRCANTPAAAPVDEHGCSPAEFCARQALSKCRRADFANDEPLVKKPRDCERASQQCTAAAP